MTENEELNIPAAVFGYILAIMTLLYGHMARTYVAYIDHSNEFIRRFQFIIIALPAILLTLLFIFNNMFYGYEVSYLLISLLFGTFMASIFLLQIGYYKNKTVKIAKVQMISLSISILVVVLSALFGYQNLNLLFLRY